MLYYANQNTLLKNTIIIFYTKSIFISFGQLIFTSYPAFKKKIQVDFGDALHQSKSKALNLLNRKDCAITDFNTKHFNDKLELNRAGKREYA